MLVVAPASVPCATGAEPARPAQDSVAAPPGGVLVLRDGGVLTGQISQSANRYLVARGGAEISVPAANVALVCGTLEEAYQRQRSALQSPTTDAHLALADWCLRSGLYPQAAQELLAARTLDPRHPRLELLERRLAVITRPAPQPSTTVAPSAVATANPQAAPTGGTNPVPLSTSADAMPDGVVERFTRKVQPVLVNNCTLAGCHRPGGPQSFELDRALLHGMANRRSTMHNLTAVLALVDHERPHESPLLTIPRRDHGGMNHPIFGPRQSQQFQQLVDWVALVTGSANGDEETPAADDGQTAESPAEPEPPPRWREPVTRVAYDERGAISSLGTIEKRAAMKKAAVKAAATAGDDEAALPPFRPSQLRYGANVRAWQPKDPFDPEIFNRQTRQAAPQNASAPPHD